MCFKIESPSGEEYDNLKNHLAYQYAEGIEDLFSKSVFPKNPGIIISQFEGINTASISSYSLIPHWMKNDNIKYSTYNSRSEDVLEKKTFKPYFISSRCLVPMKAFYEYSGQRGSGGRLVYKTSLKDNSLMVAGGIFSVWIDENGKKRPTFAIMTVTPNERCNKLYERMPAILEKDNWDLWLNRDFKEPKVLQSLCKTFDHENIKVEEVTKEGELKKVLD